MSRDQFDDQQDEIPEDELLEGQEPEDSTPSAGYPAWFISAAIHGLVALVFWYVVFASKPQDEELPPMKVTTMDQPPKKEEKKPERDVEAKVDVAIEQVADVQSPIQTLDVKIEETNASEEDTESKDAKGREEAVSQSETGGQGAFMAIGAGGGGAGMMGNRSGGGKKRAIAKGGGSRASESAVDAALRWFKRHQSPNGMWDVEKYPNNCTEAPKCEPGSASAAGASDANIACTGYAVLCFLGAGYDHKTPSKFKATVQKGLEYLRAAQKPDGLLGVRNYEHAVAAMALAEAYAMTNDADLKGPSQKAINIVIARQNKDTRAADSAYNGLGWDYENPGARNDASVTGWNVMALKSALAGGLAVGNSMDSAKKWLERAWKASNPDWAKLTDPYAATSTFAYCWYADSDKIEIDPPGSANHDLAPVGALSAVFLGHHAGDIMLETLCNHIMKYQFPASYPCNTYYMYYNTLAVFQAGGDRWKKWNESVRDMLVNAQRRNDGCFDGSWNAEGTVFHGHEVGRVLSTAYCCLCLEVYYRYKVVGADAKGK